MGTKAADGFRPGDAAQDTTDGCRNRAVRPLTSRNWHKGCHLFPEMPATMAGHRVSVILSFPIEPAGISTPQPCSVELRGAALLALPERRGPDATGRGGDDRRAAGLPGPAPPPACWPAAEARWSMVVRRQTPYTGSAAIRSRSLPAFVGRRAGLDGPRAAKRRKVRRGASEGSTPRPGAQHRGLRDAVPARLASARWAGVTSS